MLPVAVARSSSGRVTNPKGKEQFWGLSSPLTMHCTSYHLGPIQERLNRSRCRLDDQWAWLGSRNSVLRGVTISEGEWTILGKHVPNNSLWIANWTGLCSGVHTIKLDCKRWTILSAAPRTGWGWNCTPRAKADIYDYLDLHCVERKFEYLQNKATSFLNVSPNFGLIASARRSSQVLSTLLDAQCGKLATIVGRRFITLSVRR